MIILSIETSCDETAVSIIKLSREKKVTFEVLSNKVLSQIDIHEKYGGVFPAMAKREHEKAITLLITEALSEANLLTEKTKTFHLENGVRKKLEKLLEKEKQLIEPLKTLFEGINKPKVDLIAVTEGPGLEPSLWVGINTAKALRLVWGIPIYAINHMEGHVVSSIISKNKDSKFELEEIKLPAITLLISGGHTELVLVEKLGKYKIIGNTRDDAVGEAFDKVARMLGLRYPGGPEISKLAEIARSENIIIPDELELPRPMINSKDLDFSFSGLKTAVLTRIKNLENLTEKKKKILALSFEESVTEVLVSKTKSAIEKHNAKSLIVGGGVSANKYIRENLKRLSKEENFDIFLPEKNMSTDNALMIAIVSAIKVRNNIPPSKSLKATGDQRIDRI